MSNGFSVLVIGCKKHEQIANRFYKLVERFWPEIINSTIFCSDELSDYQKEFAKRYVVEKEKSYSDRIKTGLLSIDSEYVLLLLDDYFISRKIDNESFCLLLDNIQNNNLNYCKLIGLPMCFKKFKAIKKTYRIKKNTHYGISLQPSIWKKSELLNALSLCDGTNAWEVESAFSRYQENYYDKCITFNKNVLSIKNGVLRGKVAPYTNKLLMKNGIEMLDMPKVSSIKYSTFMLKQHIAMHLPIFVRSIGKKIGKKFGKKYYSEK